MPNYTSRAQPVRHHYRSTTGSYVHERDVLVHSTSSRTRSLSFRATRSVKGVFVHYIQQITCSVTSHTRMARGLVSLWQDETVHRQELTAPRCSEGRNFSEREIWVNGLRERFVHLKDSFKKNESFTNVTSLLSLKNKDRTACCALHSCVV